jgi:signal-transduction protein with cAMP-binding, CBS, and nucleotidyltransferase domain
MKVTYAVGNIMTEKIVSVNARDRLAVAMKTMVERNIGSVVVTDQRDKVGIVTERDVLRCFCDDVQAADRPVEAIMSRPLITVDTSTSIGEAADRMAAKKVRRLLVTRDGSICGLVTERDLMRATLDVFIKLRDAWV